MEGYSLSETMKVSVIIPAYNEEKYIAKTLQAVLAQDYQNFEVIVVDNNSADKTGDIARSFQNVRVIIEHKKGAHQAREAGRRSATGQLIALLDADCLPEKDWISKGVGYFTLPEIVAVSGPSYYFDTGLFFRWFSLWLQRTLYVNVNLLFQFLHVGAVMIANNSFVRSKSLADSGGFDTSIAFYGDDTDMALKLSKLGTVIFSGKLVMKTSGRRFTRTGIIKTAFLYFINFFWILFRGKPYTPDKA